MTASADPQPARLPDFFIVGHPKSGTTALWDMLKTHPQIYIPRVKEPYFLADELRPPLATPRTFGWTPDTLEEYLSLFAPAEREQRTGEASAPYLWSRTAAERIAELQPAARIIAILREPASFLHSLHLQLVQIYIEPEKSLRKALALEQPRREGRKLPSNRFWGPHATLYSEYVHYVDQLRRFHARFPPEQVLVLIYDDYRQDNEATVRRVQRFLDVDDTLPVLGRRSNPTVRVRSQRLHTFAHALASGRGPLPRAVQATARTLTPPALSRDFAFAIRNRILFGAPRAPDAGLMLELRRRFKPEVVALSEYLGRDLVRQWSYDSLD
ncbi:MAG: sulfotransferase family protein [Solirubrobacteraceae bacterium]